MELTLINSRRQVTSQYYRSCHEDRNGGTSPKYRPVLYKQEAKLSLSGQTVLPHSTFVAHVTSSVTWPFDTYMPFPVVLWNQASISNGFRDIKRNVTQWFTW